MNNVTAAKLLIPCLDLTSLSTTDSEYSVADLCQKAQTRYGNTAAVCIFSQFIKCARQELSNTNIKIATVVNFPKGENNLSNLATEIDKAITLGADEIDAVFPYRDFLAKDFSSCEKFLETARQLCEKRTLKIILETGELKTTNNIKRAATMAIESGANFIKTSTGKSKVSATPEAANIMLETLQNSQYAAGFKASGGIKTTDDAKQYLILAQTIMGNEWLKPDNFRIGASSLLKDLLETIARGY